MTHICSIVSFMLSVAIVVTQRLLRLEHWAAECRFDFVFSTDLFFSCILFDIPFPFGQRQHRVRVENEENGNVFFWCRPFVRSFTADCVVNFEILGNLIRKCLCCTVIRIVKPYRNYIHFKRKLLTIEHTCTHENYWIHHWRGVDERDAHSKHSDWEKENGGTTMKRNDEKE